MFSSLQKDKTSVGFIYFFVCGFRGQTAHVDFRWAWNLYRSAAPHLPNNINRNDSSFRKIADGQTIGSLYNPERLPSRIQSTTLEKKYFYNYYHYTKDGATIKAMTGNINIVEWI